MQINVFVIKMASASASLQTLSVCTLP